ncbi:CRISPR-associated endonuclease Cas2 [Vibrio sp. PID23_8]|uniref:CRISPR-associated endonuclease Cas2 n=1 Tax=Vibrio sp. PID23_8 TaxID=1583767 RepID=UPI000E689807|nr:CRISPR-associated endonuclease Cas2 [Vibrio sp. PID23_8]RIZ56028.1 CRISPR-associated protein Cas2 [Vibrio sp. PID23_8]
MNKEHLYLVTYDISDSKRLRRVFRLLEGYGEWVQLSVFQCRLSARRHQRLTHELNTEIVQKDDHVLIFNLGVANDKKSNVTSLGRTFEPVTKEAVII